MQRACRVAGFTVALLIAGACAENKLNVGANDAGADVAERLAPTDASLPEASVDADTPRDAATLDAQTEICSGASGSSGANQGSISCVSSYNCPSGFIDIECRCPEAQCTCRGKTFAFVEGCQPGCGPTDAIRVACGITVGERPPPDGGTDGSSGSSTSGGR